MNRFVMLVVGSLPLLVIWLVGWFVDWLAIVPPRRAGRAGSAASGQTKAWLSVPRSTVEPTAFNICSNCSGEVDLAPGDRLRSSSKMFDMADWDGL